MTPNEITALIASNFDRELDFPFRLQLMDRVHLWRSRLIENHLRKRPQDRPLYKQTIYLNMQTAQSLPDDPLVSETVAVSVDEVPQLIRSSPLFDYVGGVDGKSPYTLTSETTSEYLVSRFTPLFPHYQFINQRIKTANAQVPRIRLDAIFFDPVTADIFSCTQSEADDCDSWDKPYPITGDMLQLIVQSILTVDYNRPEKEASPEVQ